MNQQKGLWSQCFSIVISIALIASSLSLADLAHASTPASPVAGLIENLSIPHSLGFVTDAYLPLTPSPAHPLVVLIQDLHLHYPTQKRIIKILDHLYNKNI